MTVESRKKHISNERRWPEDIASGGLIAISIPEELITCPMSAPFSLKTFCWQHVFLFKSTKRDRRGDLGFEKIEEDNDVIVKSRHAPSTLLGVKSKCARSRLRTGESSGHTSAEP